MQGIYAFSSRPVYARYYVLKRFNPSLLPPPKKKQIRNIHTQRHTIQKLAFFHQGTVRDDLILL